MLFRVWELWWNAISHPCSNFNDSLTKPLLKFGLGSVITSHDEWAKWSHLYCFDTTIFKHQLRIFHFWHEPSCFLHEKWLETHPSFCPHRLKSWRSTSPRSSSHGCLSTWSWNVPPLNPTSTHSTPTSLTTWRTLKYCRWSSRRPTGTSRYGVR